MYRPEAMILAGPNGAGKTTASRLLVPAGVSFLNSDVVMARLVAEGHPEAGVEAAAGRIVLHDLRKLVAEGAPFCIETNLAGRGFLRHIGNWRRCGYDVGLIFVALTTPELAMARVATRVASGGHRVPEAVIRRRWAIGLRAFFDDYGAAVDSWTLYDNSGQHLRTVATRAAASLSTEVVDLSAWARLRRSVG